MCKRILMVHARGLCRACYSKAFRDGECEQYVLTAEQREEADRIAEQTKVTCLNCSTGAVYSRGLCYSCYRVMLEDDRLDEFLPCKYRNRDEMLLWVCLEKFDRETAWELPEFSEETERKIE